MNANLTEATTPLWLTASLFFLATTGISFLVWGRSLFVSRPSILRWSLAPSLTLVLAALLVEWRTIVDDGARYWMRGWIGSTDLPGAVTAGLVSDPVGLAAAAILLLVVVLFSVAVNPVWNPDRAERTSASIALATAGSILSWQSLTPWVSIFGVTLCALAGFISLGTSWHTEEDGSDAIHLAFERVFLLSVTIMGACAFLFRQSPSVWRPGGEALQTLSLTETGGAVLMVAAVFAQSNAFPMLSGLRAIARSGRFVVLQLLPFWALFALLLRMNVELREAGLFPHFGWFAVAAGTFSVIYGLFQESWRLSFAAWNSAGFSFAVAVLAAVGPLEGSACLLALTFPSAAIAFLTSELKEDNGRNEFESSKSDGIARVILFCAVAMGTGIIGSVGTAAGIEWMALQGQAPVLAVVIALAWMTFVLLGWRLAWKAPRELGSMGWTVLVPAGLLVVLALGLVWTGSFSGDALSGLGIADTVFPSLLAAAFSKASVDGISEGAYVTALALGGAAQVIGILLAYWSSSGERDSFKVFAAKAPGFATAIRSGYGVDWLGSLIQARAKILGAAMIASVDRKVWGQWIPTSLHRSVFWLNNGMIRVEARAWPALCGSLTRFLAVPGKLLQLLQNGDVRWYAFFAMASVLALAAHLLSKGGA